MEVILLLGAPGSGKGTLAQQLMRRKPAMRHVSSGDLLREAVSLGTPAGREAGAIMKRGELVSDALIGRMIHDFLKKGNPDACYLLDGFPRTKAQAGQLDAILAECAVPLRAAVLLDVPESILLDRITGRRVCPDCKNIYHLTGRPPKTPGQCDACHTALIQRADDHVDTVKRRLAVYRDATADLITLYAARHLLITLPANAAPDVLAEKLSQALEAKN